MLFRSNYIKTAWLEIIGNQGSYYGAMREVPSNYLNIGCKGITTLGQTLTSTGVNLMWDYYTITGSTKLQYSYDGGAVTTAYPTCPAWSLPMSGSQAYVTVTVTCPDGSVTSKSTTVVFPVQTPTTSPTTSPKKGKK